MPKRTDVRVVLIRFLPFDVPEYADSDGWLYHSVSCNKKAYHWAHKNEGIVEDAYFVGSGEYIIRNGEAIFDERLQVYKEHINGYTTHTRYDG